MSGAGIFSTPRPLPSRIAPAVAGGTIIVRQRGRRFRPGINTGLGKDDTIFAKTAGRVRFEDHGARGRVISVLPLES